MRVLVTGGAGFIGSHVVAQSLARGFDVAVLDNFSTGRRQNVPSGVPIFEVDLRDAAATRRALEAFRPELVSHQAAQASVPSSMKDPRLDAEVNVLGGLNLLDACQAAGVRRLVYASTGGASYGEVSEGARASENDPQKPKSPYGISKLAFEQLLSVLGPPRKLQTFVLRYGNVYGPRQEPRGEAGVVAIFFDRVLAGKALSVFARRVQGDGGCVRDYTFVGDVALANFQAMTGDLPFDTLNVATGEGTTTLELARQIISLTGSSSSIHQAGARPGDVERSVLDPTRYLQALGTPTPLAHGLAETARYYRER